MYGKYTVFYKSPKNWGYYAHVQTVCTRPLLRGGKGPGYEANTRYACMGSMVQPLHHMQLLCATTRPKILMLELQVATGACSGRVSTVELENHYHDIPVTLSKLPMIRLRCATFTCHLGYLASVFLMGSKWIESHTDDF